jgi:hypothetical protein
MTVIHSYRPLDGSGRLALILVFLGPFRCRPSRKCNVAVWLYIFIGLLAQLNDFERIELSCEFCTLHSGRLLLRR